MYIEPTKAPDDGNAITDDGDNASWRDKPFITIIMEEVPALREVGSRTRDPEYGNMGYGRGGAERGTHDMCVAGES